MGCQPGSQGRSGSRPGNPGRRRDSAGDRGVIVSSDELDFWAPGATAFRSPKPDAIEVFQVTGADHTGYLRTGVGDYYADGRWRQVSSHGIPYEAGTQPRGLVVEWLLGISEPGVSLSGLTIGSNYWGALLAWPDKDAIALFVQDEVTVSSIGPEETVPAEFCPYRWGCNRPTSTVVTCRGTPPSSQSQHSPDTSGLPGSHSFPMRSFNGLLSLPTRHIWDCLSASQTVSPNLRWRLPAKQRVHT